MSYQLLPVGLFGREDPAIGLSALPIDECLKELEAHLSVLMGDEIQQACGITRERYSTIDDLQASIQEKHEMIARKIAKNQGVVCELAWLRDHKLSVRSQIREISKHAYGYHAFLKDSPRHCAPEIKLKLDRLQGLLASACSLDQTIDFRLEDALYARAKKHREAQQEIEATTILLEHALLSEKHGKCNFPLLGVALSPYQQLTHEHDVFVAMYGHSEDERLANLGTIRFCVDYVYVCRDIVEVVLAKIKHYARREDNFGKGLADMVPLWRRRLLRWLSCHEDVEGELDGFYETIVSGCRQIQAHIGAGDFPELAASLMDVRDYAHAARLGISCKIEELRYSICDWNLPDKTLESRLRELLDIERSCLDGEGDIFEIDGPVSPLSFHLDDEDEFELDYDITCTITPHPSGTAVYTNFTSHM